MGQCACAKGGSEGKVNRLMTDTDSRSQGGRLGKSTKNNSKILLLGTGNSGKSTVFKQFQLKHSNGFSEAERNYYRTLMVESTIMTVRKMIQSANDLLFEGEMHEEEFDRKLVQKMRHDAQEKGMRNGPKMSFTEFVSEESTPSGRHTGRSTIPSYCQDKPRPSDISEGSSSGGSGGRATDISESGSVRAGDIEVSATRSSTGGKKPVPMGLDRYGGSTVISDEVAHLAEIILGLPEGTQLYEKVSVVRTYTQEGKHGSEEVSEETEEMTVAEILQILWEEPVLRRVYQMEGKIPTLEAPIGYYMENLDRISSKSFTPSEDDMLHARKQTRKVQELDFVHKNHKFLLIDVGGQRIERRNWINYFDEVDIILYVVGLDGFSQLCIEDGRTNRMRESLEVFKDLCESPFFSQTNIILFLNKSDIFREKIQKISLNTCFQSYSGPAKDADAAIKYVSKRFCDTHDRIVQRNTSVDDLMSKVYPFETVATATENMENIINSCQGIFLRKGMQISGMI
ncbi:Guanine nucleotide-binding protein subunit alpha [Hondaea fermentalgiana]|uniref:Guanine nucleotide-binding protein subunit alpha n=1 Tax=Hondaea fermentalgiana TaxID=2315210 RepID=A0A2R5GTN7_9STRA|nr:Guanine nucleotide-binding protein subunit alpha [Hondaea fermentalgiana]|eukprot:GBG33689.1 Guanine nucleotide-binding protein subunit alpha [Hondaea fermentalgiana]